MNAVQNALQKSRPLIAAHRGSYRASIPCNTLDAFDIALRLGASIIETDVQRSADGELFLFHSGLERAFLNAPSLKLGTMSAKEIRQLVLVNDSLDPTWYRIPTLDEGLEHLKGRCIINLDRCEDFWEDVIPVIDRHGMADQIIFKSPAKRSYFERASFFAHRIMYMPVVNEEDNATATLNEMGIPFAGVEVVFKEESSPLCSEEYIESQHRSGRFLWVNGLVINRDYSLCANHDDETAMTKGADAGWGWLINKGYDIIQTDWTGELNTYIQSRKVIEFV